MPFSSQKLRSGCSHCHSRAITAQRAQFQSRVNHRRRRKIEARVFVAAAASGEGADQFVLPGPDVLVLLDENPAKATQQPVALGVGLLGRLFAPPRDAREPFSRLGHRADAQRRGKNLHPVLFARQQACLFEPADGGSHTRVVGRTVAFEAGVNLFDEDFARGRDHFAILAQVAADECFLHILFGFGRQAGVKVRADKALLGQESRHLFAVPAGRAVHGGATRRVGRQGGGEQFVNVRQLLGRCGRQDIESEVVAPGAAVNAPQIDADLLGKMGGDVGNHVGLGRRGQAEYRWHRCIPACSRMKRAT
jgi:hypothetical protein